MPQDNNQPFLYILAGPTGVGKTRIAVQLARRWKAEIISADSMQVYRQLSIGTAKPTKKECCGVPYHLIDCADIDEPYDLARFIRDADESIRQITKRGRRILIVGGTGLYIKGLLEGIFADATKNQEIRKILSARMEKEGLSSLYQELASVDPDAAARIKPRDLQRIIRALEVYLTTGIPISALQEKSRRSEPRYPHVLLFLTRKREELYQSIEKRVDLMFEKGLVEEVHNILNEGFPQDLHPLKALGYREVICALEGEWPLEKARQEMKKATRRYAKRQITWFKAMPRAVWVDLSRLPEDRVLPEIERIFESGRA
jgi:tRNA dimethylallyltransferase